MVEIKSEAVPGQSFTGRVWFISPVLNEETRTVKVLLNISNAEQKLKPGMFVSAVIRAELMADGKPAPTGVEGQWTCPMDPRVLQPQAGECPDHKMALVQIPGTPASAKPEGDRLVLAVPAVLQGRPGRRRPPTRRGTSTPKWRISIPGSAREWREAPRPRPTQTLSYD